MSEHQNKPTENSSQVIKNGNIYTAVYGLHDRPTSPQSIPPDSNCVVLENTFRDWSDQQQIETLLEEWQTNDPQFSQLLTSLAGKRMPVALLDPHFSPDAIHQEEAARNTEGVLGALSIATAYYADKLLGLMGRRPPAQSDRAEPPTLHRRSWLRRAILGLVFGGGGAYLAQPIGTKAATQYAYRFDRGKGVAAWNNRLCHHMHPGLQELTVNIRNAIIAYKEQWYATHGNARQRICTVLGPDHEGCFEDDLQRSPEELLRYLRSPDIRGTIRKHLAADSTLYSIAECTYDGKAWRLSHVSEIPELKALLMQP